MTMQTINIGTTANDGTGDTLRAAGDKINDNFTELYAAIAAAGASWKAPVRVATTAAGTLATSFENGDTVDGVTLVTGDRILIKDQSTASENGIYLVAASGAPTRATDADVGAELVNAAVLVSEGSANADKLFICTTNAPITLGSTGLTFTNPFAGIGGTGSSTTQLLSGTDTSSFATPDAVAALWEQGSDVASAGTVSLGEGGYFNITGTTTITDIDFATDKAGRKAWVKFAGALTLTHNASTLILPGGASITTAAGDTACFVSEGSDVVRCVAYQKANGKTVARDYRIGFFFTTAPSASEVLLLHVASDAFTIPANFATPDAKGSVGTNPAASFALDVQKNGSTIGTITISTGGAFTFATSSGTSKSIAAGDVIKIVGPSSADASIANVAITLMGVI